ncbi:MAG TPA: hypothetical protein VM890_16850 [Longimicrobium sp.]|nr:hypothetical protein [Longimicrobium sp.]
MRSVRRVLLSLAFAAVGSAPWSLPSAAQARAGPGGAAPLLRGVARMPCGTPRPRIYRLTNPAARGGSGTGTMAAQGQVVMLRSAALVGTLELSFGGQPRRGMADAERPAGSWTAPQLGYCTGGRGPLHLAVITPAADGRSARFELRGPASHLQRPGERAGPEGGEVRFVGTCGRRQQVVMEIWPPVALEAGQARSDPERYYLVGTVTCAPAAPDAASADTTPAVAP